LTEVRQGGSVLAVAAIERSGRRGRYQKLGILLSIVLYPLFVGMGVSYLMANGVLVILLTLVSYVFGHEWTYATASGGGHYSPSTNTSEQAVLAPAPRLVPTDRDTEIVALALQ
jgi:hypothetical protein